MLGLPTHLVQELNADTVHYVANPKFLSICAFQNKGKKTKQRKCVVVYTQFLIQPQMSAMYMRMIKRLDNITFVEIH